MQVKNWFTLTVAIVVKVLGHVQNMYVEILLGLCQKGSFEIDFFYFTEPVGIDVICHVVYIYTPPLSFHSYQKGIENISWFLWH